MPTLSSEVLSLYCCLTLFLVKHFPLDYPYIHSHVYCFDTFLSSTSLFISIVTVKAIVIMLFSSRRTKDSTNKGSSSTPVSSFAAFLRRRRNSLLDKLSSYKSKPSDMAPMRQRSFYLESADFTLLPTISTTHSLQQLQLVTSSHHPIRFARLISPLSTIESVSENSEKTATIRLHPLYPRVGVGSQNIRG